MLHIPCILYWPPLGYGPIGDEMPIRVENFYSAIWWIGDVHPIVVCIDGYGRWT